VTRLRSKGREQDLHRRLHGFCSRHRQGATASGAWSVKALRFALSLSRIAKRQYIVANKDRTVQPELQRFVAKRMGATTFETDSSHVPMLSQPGFVLDVIRKAAKAVQNA
jgi:pimeloyl-ACP methyl ester carboxylesterase